MALVPTPSEPESLGDSLARHGRRGADHRALVFEDEVASWRGFASNVAQVAESLARLGVRRGDRVAMLTETVPAAVEGFLGVVLAGGAAVPLPEAVHREALRRMVADADPKVVIATEGLREVASSCGFEGACLALDFTGPGWCDIETSTSMEASLPDGSPTGDDPFDLVYSSGTTGEPKGIVHSHRMRACQIDRMSRFGLDGESVMLLTTPLCSNTTLIALLPTLARGGTVVLERRFAPRRFLAAAKAHGVTHAMLVPTQIGRILDEPGFGAGDMSSLQVVFCTGAMLPAAHKRALLERWPGRLVEIYGQTEGGPTTILDARAHPDELDSVGRPAEGVDIRLLDEDGREVARGEVGEIVGRAESMMTGYHGRPDLTAALTWHDEAGRAFFRTGDLGRFDEAGFLHLVGRRKDVIISGAQNVYPEDLERVLTSHAAVAEAAVIGVPSAAWGETPWAFVVPKPDTDVDPDELKTWVHARVGKKQRLSGIELRLSLPRNVAGKVLKRELRRRHPPSLP